MLSPSSSLPARTMLEPVTVTSSCAPFRHSELRLELPMRCPRESGLMTTVIVKGATFECFEKNVPDHVPLKSVAGCCVDPAPDEERPHGLVDLNDADSMVPNNDT